MSKQAYFLVILGIAGWIATGTVRAQESSGLSDGLTVQELSRTTAAQRNQPLSTNVAAVPAPLKTYWMLQQARTFPEIWSEGPDLPAYRAFFVMLEQELQTRTPFHEALPIAQKMSGLSDANVIWVSRRLASVGALFEREYPDLEGDGKDSYWLLKQGRTFPKAWSDGPDLAAYRAFFAHLAEGKESSLPFPAALNLAQRFSGVSDANLVWLTQRLASVSAGR